jgi:hypothetical protein
MLKARLSQRPGNSGSSYLAEEVNNVEAGKKIRCSDEGEGLLRALRAAPDDKRSYAEYIFSEPV